MEKYILYAFYAVTLFFIGFKLGHARGVHTVLSQYKSTMDSMTKQDKKLDKLYDENMALMDSTINKYNKRLNELR